MRFEKANIGAIFHNLSPWVCVDAKLCIRETFKFSFRIVLLYIKFVSECEIVQLKLPEEENLTQCWDNERSNRIPFFSHLSLCLSLSFSPWKTPCSVEITNDLPGSVFQTFKSFIQNQQIHVLFQKEKLFVLSLKTNGSSLKHLHHQQLNFFTFETFCDLKWFHRQSFQK